MCCIEKIKFKYKYAYKLQGKKYRKIYMQRAIKRKRE